MAERNALFLSVALIIPAAFGCSGSSTSSSTSSSGSTSGSGGTTGGSIEPVDPPTFTPKGETANNDFMVIALAQSGATICYRVDGQKPTCDLASAACTGGAQTYSGVTQIAISGAITNPTTGSVSVEAIACVPATPPSPIGSANYVLQVAAPTMSSPAGNSTLAYNGSKPLDPEVSTATLSSASDDVQIWYTVGAPPSTAPTCGTGAGPIPATGSGSSGVISTAAGGIQSFLSSTTFQAIGCKQGYLPSAVTTIAYNVQLNPPGFLPVNPDQDGGVWPATTTSFDYNVIFQVDDSLNAGSSDYLCVVAGSSAAACDPAGDCDAGTMLTPAGAIVGSIQIGNAATFSASLSGVACGSNGLSSSMVATSGPYSLLLDPVTSNPASGATIPSSGSLQLTLEQSPADSADPAGATPAPYDYICWTEDGTTPSCAMDCPASQAGLIDGVLQGQQHANGTSVGLPSSGPGSLDAANFSAGVTLVAVGCLNSTPPPTVVYGPAPLSDIVINPPQ